MRSDVVRRRAAPAWAGGALLAAWAAGLAGADGSAVLQQATATAVPDLVLDGGRVVLSGDQVYGRVELRGRARIEIQPYSGSSDTGRLEIRADTVVVERGASIQGDEAGYRGRLRNDGEGPGGGQGGWRTLDGGGGGGHGGRGGDGVLDGVPRSGALGGRAYGAPCTREVDRGSAGGAPGSADNPTDPGAGANGGGALVLIADTVLISGTISLNGGDGIVAANDAAGGGAGGGVLVVARHLEQSGRIEARGGAGAQADDGGGGGGGGRIKLFYATGSVNRRVLDVAGGRGDGNGYRNDGDAGSVCVEVEAATATSSPTPTMTASPTPTPSATSATSTATATTTASVTPSTTATYTVTPSPVPTAPPAPRYLPLVLGEKCVESVAAPVAVALVIDASTSMLAVTRANRRKLDAALDAAGIAVGLMAPHHAMALVTFHQRAEIRVPLTGDRHLLEAGLRGVGAERGSRLDEGVRLGAAALADAPDGATRRMVVLTDGRPNPSSPQDALLAAQRARDEGIVLDVVGLGDDADGELLTRMAGSPERYHEAPDGEDLLALFADLAWRPPPCGGQRYWPFGRR